MSAEKLLLVYLLISGPAIGFLITPWLGLRRKSQPAGNTVWVDHMIKLNK